MVAPTGPTDDLRVALFGGLDIRWHGEPWPSPNRADAVRLLTYILLHGELSLDRERIAFTLWPDTTERDALGRLRRHIHHLSEALPPAPPGRPWLLKTSRTLMWNTDALPGLDSATFERLLGRAEILTGAGHYDEARSALHEALALYQGDLMPELGDAWLDPVRQHLRSRYLRALEAAAGMYESAGALAEAVATLQRLLAEEPANEPAHRQLMGLFERQGEHDAALRQFTLCQSALVTALSVAPAPETVALFEFLKAGERPSTGPSAAPPARPADQPVRGIRPPRPISPFVGRSHELETLATLLAEHRLVCLVGTGGVGKTRLAAEVAWLTADQYSAGALWATLADVADSELVIQEVARAVGVATVRDRPLVAAVIDHLSVGSTLLVLDSCEHVLEAVVELIHALLGHCPGVTVLATSRERLGLDGEQSWPAPPMAIPAADREQTMDDLLRSDAVALFVARVRANWPDYAPDRAQLLASADICRRLDGIPLAIELAAARVGVLSESEILARLDEGLQLLHGRVRQRPTRHETMDDAIAWGYDLLAGDEQRLFRQLAVFAGGFTLAAVTSVAGEVASAPGPAQGTGIVDGLARLIDTSFVLAEAGGHGDRRYRLLHVLRHFGRERLREAGEDDVLAARHAAYFSHLAAEAEPHLSGSEQAQWLDALEADRDNFRGAMAWLLDHDDVSAALQLAGTLWRFWMFRDHVHRERDWLAEALARAGPDVPLGVLGRAQLGLAALEYARGDLPAAGRWGSEGVATYRRLGDARLLAAALDSQAVAVLMAGDVAAARGMAEEAVSLRRAQGDEAELARSQSILADVLIQQGDEAGASALLSASLAIHRRLGLPPILVIRVLDSLTRIAHHQGRLVEAEALAEEGLELSRTAGGKLVTLVWLVRLGLVRLDRGAYESSELVLKEALRAARDLGHDVRVARQWNNLGEVALRRGEYPTARSYANKALAAKERIDTDASTLHTRLVLAEIAVEAGDPDAVTRSAEALDAARQGGDPELLAWAFRVRLKAALTGAPMLEQWTLVQSYAAQVRAHGGGREKAIAVELGALVAGEATAPGAADRLLATADDVRARMGAARTAWELAAVAGLRERRAMAGPPGAAASPGTDWPPPSVDEALAWLARSPAPE